MLYPVADLHCDLLSYLERDPKRTAQDPLSQCSLPQLSKGNVCFQALSIYVETAPGSFRKGARQVEILRGLLNSNPEIHLFNSKQFVKQGSFNPLTVAPAIENASGFLEEGERLDLLFERLEKTLSYFNDILYIGLTWGSENRFGGGNDTKIGLKKDGEELLEFMAEKKIFVDFSHTSDALAFDILNYIDQKKLSLIPIASHSNFRKIQDVPRNLPDEIAKEIFRKGGVVAVNLIKNFVGKSIEDLVSHIEQGIALGGERQLSLGADFFAEIDTAPDSLHKLPYYFQGYRDAGCYPDFFPILKNRFSEDFLQGLSHKNFESFLLNNLKRA